MKHLLILVLLVTTFFGCSETIEPAEPVPTTSQLAWHEVEMYGLVCFNLVTFEDKEWGYGDADPAIFNPAEFSADQIVNTAREGGLNGIILVCKHHEGFCLWTPLECDFSIRPGWYYHENQNDAVKSSEVLFDHYLKTVGRNASFNLGLPPDTRGIMHENDVESLKGYTGKKMIDGNPKTYWAAPENTTRAEIIIQINEIQLYRFPDRPGSPDTI